MDYIITARGRKITTDMVASIPSPAILYIRVLGMTLPEVATVFSDPSETQMITYAGQQFIGYTVLDALVPEGTAVRVNLRRI